MTLDTRCTPQSPHTRHSFSFDWHGTLIFSSKTLIVLNLVLAFFSLTSEDQESKEGDSDERSPANCASDAPNGGIKHACPATFSLDPA